jgi:hypothetical protein
MASDWHTELGQRSLNIGKKVERLVVSSLREMGFTIDHIAEDPERFFDGADVLVAGKRVEIKSNSGWSKRGAPLDTFCVEIINKVGKPIGWSSGKSDRVVIVNRRTMRAYIYRSDLLRAWSVGKRTVVVDGADCFIMPHECAPAGYLKAWDLL